jgi:hypothetical protein
MFLKRLRLLVEQGRVQQFLWKGGRKRGYLKNGGFICPPANQETLVYTEPYRPASIF